MKRITEEFLLSKGFTAQTGGVGWVKYIRDKFQIVQIPLQSGKHVYGFEYPVNHQPVYKYPITEDELSALHKLLTGKDL